MVSIIQGEVFVVKMAKCFSFVVSSFTPGIVHKFVLTS